MKIVAILALLTITLSTALMTRPGSESYQRYLEVQADQRSEPGVYRNILRSRAQANVKQCKFQNHWLWTDVTINDRVIHSGLFGHWMERNNAKRFY